MAVKRWTLVEFNVEYGEGQPFVIHKPGCKRIKEEMPHIVSKDLIKVDLDLDDEALLEALDPGGEDIETMDEVELCECTGYLSSAVEPEAEPAEVDDQDDEYDDEEDASPAPSSAAAKASQQAARARLLRQVEETIDKLVVERGVDNIGEDRQWDDGRLATCTDDYVYDLAIEVRRLRERGDSWWRVAYELHLPGSGASNKQGRKGSAFARRLWRAAWGPTYLGERGQRESKLTRETRALENLGRPYFSEADEDQRVADTVRGKMLHWVTRLEGKHGLITSAQEAYVHDDPKFVAVKQGPMGRYLEFYEQIDPSMLLADPRMSISKSGPLRAVYVDRITRVGV
jgi:hypothetical protein